MGEVSNAATVVRCGKITNPGHPYPLPCVKPNGHEGECDPRPSAERPAAIAAGCTCSAYWIDGRIVHDTTRCPIHSPLKDLSPMGGGPNPWGTKPK